MWFYTTDGRSMNLALMTGISFSSGTPGRIHYQAIGRTDSQYVWVDEAERERVARYIEASRD